MRHGTDEAVRTPSTPGAIAALAQAGYLAPVDAAALRDAYDFFRGVEQSLKLHDEHAPMLEPRGRTGAHVARSLGLRARDGMTVSEVLDDTYRRHARAVRALLSSLAAPVGAAAPWEAGSAP
ncbi:MAG: hypothetical protein M5U28_36015 [Sandaracinaceae bacterium]|nr:hypothetical protein [Sandaracinaceae bacterium]